MALLWKAFPHTVMTDKFLIFGFTILQLVFARQLLLLDFFRCFLDFLRNQQQSVFSEAFSGDFILLEVEMIRFLPIIFKLFFRAGFAHYLKMFSRFFFHLQNLGIRANDILQVLTVIRKSFLTNAVFIPIYSNCLQLVFSLASRPIFLLSLLVFLESLQYLTLSPASVFLQKSIMHNKENQNHFTVIFKIYQN